MDMPSGPLFLPVHPLITVYAELFGQLAPLLGKT